MSVPLTYAQLEGLEPGCNVAPVSHDLSFLKGDWDIIIRPTRQGSRVKISSRATGCILVEDWVSSGQLVVNSIDPDTKQRQRRTFHRTGYAETVLVEEIEGTFRFEGRRNFSSARPSIDWREDISHLTNGKLRIAYSSRRNIYSEWKLEHEIILQPRTGKSDIR